MTEQFVKMYQFKLADKTNESSFLATSEKMDSFMKSQTGFLYRSLSRQEDGLWLDSFYFTDRAAAEAMEGRFEQFEEAGQFMMLIDPASVVVTKADIVSVACTMGDAEAA